MPEIPLTGEVEDWCNPTPALCRGLVYHGNESRSRSILPYGFLVFGYLRGNPPRQNQDAPLLANGGRSAYLSLSRLGSPRADLHCWCRERPKI
jgi:hypothetical protein